MIENLDQRHPELVESCEAMMADKSYDDTKLIEQLGNGNTRDVFSRFFPKHREGASENSNNNVNTSCRRQKKEFAVGKLQEPESTPGETWSPQAKKRYSANSSIVSKS